jgi:osmoprotectant transport system permease protein
MRVLKLVCLACTLLYATLVSGAETPQPIVIGSKNFTESYILSEILAQLLESKGHVVERKFGLGGTLICFDALSNGEIDLYAEYTGTLSQAILKLDGAPSLAELRTQLAEESLALATPFGFNNTYALALKRQLAEQLGIQRISELVDKKHQVNVVVSHEFLEREDGWPGLMTTYGFDWSPGGIEHGLAYQAIADGAIDVTDAYSTDGELVRYDLAVLEDDRRFFPQYLAAPLYRQDLGAEVADIFELVGNRLDDRQMQTLNAAVVFEGKSFAEVAAGFLTDSAIVAEASFLTREATMWQRLADNTVTHLKLTGMALAGAIVAGLALAIATYRNPLVAKGVVYVTGLLQTIPSIALLALMIPLFGIGMVPAVVALFLYSLLPILRNAVTALSNVDPLLERVAVAMGLTAAEQLRHVYIPLSLPSVMAGVRTAAVISIGTATLAAFIGAGGLGDPIVTGLALNDPNLILEGAIPAALLAIATELVFEGAERLLLPRHLVGQKVG